MKKRKKKRRGSSMGGEHEYVCGYCGEPSVIEVDPTGGGAQVYVEDCVVCCRPNTIHVHVDPETLEIDVSTAYEG